MDKASTTVRLMQRFPKCYPRATVCSPPLKFCSPSISTGEQKLPARLIFWTLACSQAGLKISGIASQFAMQFGTTCESILEIA